MARYSKDRRVCLKSNLSVRGVVDFVHPLSGGKQFYDVKRVDGGIETFYEEQLMDEVVSVDCWELLSQNSLSSYQDFGIGTTLFKIRNASTNTIATLKASRTKFKPYQFKPLVKFLNSESKRLLIADEVGLGKTIEAGHIILEMVGRGLLHNCLVICKKTLQKKWQTELREKFGFEFKICEVSELINDINRDLNSGQKTVFAIINYEKCRNKNFLRVIQNSSYNIDLVICDEAQILRNSSTKIHRAVRDVLKLTGSTLFLTATPIMTDIDNLYSLVNLLEPERYFNFELFKNAINLNKPFIKACSQLNNRISLVEIANQLDKSEVSLSVTIGDTYVFSESKSVANLFGSDPLYQRARELMLFSPDNLETRAKVLADLTELNSLNHLYSRNRKREVLTENEVVVRDPHTLIVSLTLKEKEIYDSVQNQYGFNTASLGLITKKRQVASSIVAYGTSQKDLLEGRYDATIEDSKFKLFWALVEEIVRRKQEKIIVFAFFKATLRYLQLKLRELGLQCGIIHGDVDVSDRDEVIRRFREDTSLNILLSSEIGSEGLDLQFAHIVINYDLPWNPMVVEQRIGRVDRIGQDSKIVNVYSFVLKDTIEERIFHRLIDRINVFRESLGDLEEILGEGEPVAEIIKDLIHKLYTTRLTEQQQNRVIDDIALAVENERETLKKVTENLTNAIVYDIYFVDEITRIINDNKYLTEMELKNFLSSIFRLKLTTCRFFRMNDYEYKIELPNNNPRVLFNFASENLGNARGNTEMENRISQFQKLYGVSTLDVTFNQDYAYRNPKIEYINSNHPLIQASANWFLDNGYHRNRAYRICMSNDQFTSKVELVQGHYVLAIYNIALTKGSGSKRQTFNFVHATIINVSSEQPFLLSRVVSDFVLGHTQLFASEPITDVQFDEQIVNLIRPIISKEIKDRECEIEENEKIRLASITERSIAQLKLFYDNQIKRKRMLLDEGQGIKEILIHDIAKLEQEYQQKVQDLQSSTVECRNELISINYLQII